MIQPDDFRFLQQFFLQLKQITKQQFPFYFYFAHSDLARYRIRGSLGLMFVDGCVCV